MRICCQVKGVLLFCVPSLSGGAIWDVSSPVKFGFFLVVVEGKKLMMLIQLIQNNLFFPPTFHKLFLVA